MATFHSLFPDEGSCLDFVFRKRYPDLAGSFYRIKGRKEYVNSKGEHISPLVGTIFEGSRTPLRKWFLAINLFSQSKSGVSAAFLSRHLSVTYKTAWRMAHLIRTLMKQDVRFLEGIVEADETYVGGRNKFRNPSLDTPVLGLIERGGFLSAVVAPRGNEAIIENLKSKVRIGSTVMTDKLRIYRESRRHGFKHKSVNHGIREYVRGHVHTNTIENFWGQFKRSIRGTHHSVSKKHLQLYVDEFVFRRNNRDHNDAFTKMIARV